MELKKIGVWSAAKIATIFGFIAGILSIIFLSIMQSLQKSIPAEDLASAGMAPVQLDIQTALIVLVTYTVIGLIYGAIAAFAYNLIAKLVGGIKLDFAGKKK